MLIRLTLAGKSMSVISAAYRKMVMLKGANENKSPAREGPALLQGLIVCGRCGRRMTVRYHWRRGGLAPDYVCQRKGIENAEPICQRVSGAEVDRFVGNLLVEFINPITLDVALAVQQEL